MKLRAFLIVMMVLLIMGVPCDRAVADIKPAPHLAPPSASQSEFIIRHGYGKDPFYPRSTRLQVRNEDKEPDDKKANVPDFIVVKGISFSKGRKLTIINNYTVGEGEEFDLRRGGKVIKVRCVEIKEQAVIVAVDGASKSIPLKLD